MKELKKKKTDGTKQMPSLTREQILKGFSGIGLLLLSFLLGRCEVLLSARPFGIAFLSAAEGLMIWVYAGAVLSALPVFGGTFEPILLASYTAVVLLRILIRMTVDLPYKRDSAESTETVHSFQKLRKSFFKEQIPLRMMTASLGGFLPGVANLIAGGYQVYDLLASLFLIAVCPLCCYLFSGLWKPGILRSPAFRDLFPVLGICAAFLLAIHNMRFYGIALPAFAALFLTLWIERERGIAVGILAGLLFGMAVDPITAPLYAFAALSAGGLRRVSGFMASLSALLVGMAWGLYVYGISAVSGLFPALFASSMLFCVLDQLHLLPGGGKPPFEQKKDRPGREIRNVREELPPPKRGAYRAESGEAPVEEPAFEALLAKQRVSDEKETLDGLCTAFLSLSALLGELREKRKYPSRAELRRVCDRVCDEFCPGCVSCGVCWGSEYAHMAETLNRMAETLATDGRVTPDILPDDIRARCRMSGELLLRINEAAGALTETAVKREKSGILSADYATAAELFRSAFRFDEADYLVDESRSHAADRLLRSYGIYPTAVAVTGGRAPALYAKGVEEARVRTLWKDRNFEKRFLQAVGFPPKEPLFSEIPGCEGLKDLRIPPSPRYRVRSAAVSRTARKGGRSEKDCGDSVSVFRGKDGRMFALLSDGMGSGGEAAYLSGTCSLFLRKMLSTGGETGVILKMLNDFLIAGTEGETSATVDLLEFDCLTGDAAFWKSGAAPTFILRDGNLFRLSSHTVPAGILPDADFQRTAFPLYAGDLVVMLSDGITDTGEDCDYLYTLLGGTETDEGLLRAANAIADRKTGNGTCTDDKSVILFAVEDATEVPHTALAETGMAPDGIAS